MSRPPRFFCNVLVEGNGSLTPLTEDGEKRPFYRLYGWAAPDYGIDRMAQAVGLARETQTGQELFYPGAKPVWCRFDRRSPRGGTYEPEEKRVTIGDLDEKAMPALYLIHEVAHARSDESTIGSRTETLLGDHGYRRLVGEAHAFTLETVGAYELLLKGHDQPWSAHTSGVLRPLSDALLGAIEEGFSPTTTHAKRAVFNAWMTSSLRNKYEENLLDVSLHDRSRVKDLPAGISLSNTQLADIARDRHGNSYLDGMDLKSPAYTGIWQLASRANIHIVRAFSDEIESLGIPKAVWM